MARRKVGDGQAADTTGSPMDTNGGGGGFAEPAAEVKDALAGGFFGKGADVKFPATTPEPKPEAAIADALAEKKNVDDLPRHANVRFADEVFIDEDVGQEIEATHPEEMYGMKGSFSSYRVGPFTAKTRIRAVETRQSAYRRLLDELEEVAAEERPRAKAAFLKHYENAFVNG